MISKHKFAEMLTFDGLYNGSSNDCNYNHNELSCGILVSNPTEVSVWIILNIQPSYSKNFKR